MVAHERWSPTGGGLSWRFECICTIYSSLSAHCCLLDKKKLKKRDQIKGQNGTGVSNVYDGTNMKIRKIKKKKKRKQLKGFIHLPFVPVFSISVRYPLPKLTFCKCKNRQWANPGCISPPAYKPTHRLTSLVTKYYSSYSPHLDISMLQLLYSNYLLHEATLHWVK